ncbi:MAG: rhomboid family intramembrane serine protease [Spirochaetales bacterium]|nr:rhomboid family intramembrane serine protease [Spirochaetales bacterium]
MSNSFLRKPFVYRQYNAAFILVFINIAVFLLTMALPRATVYLAMIPGYVIEGHAYWQLFTYMFVHSNFTHILFNMIALFFFGTAVERSLGSTEFLVFYLITGLGAGLFSFAAYVATGSYVVILLGASGAVYGVLLAYAALFPGSTIYVMGIIPVRAPVLVAIYAAIEVLSQFSGARSGVAHLTHLAGFGFAWLYFLLRLGRNPLDMFRGGGRRW